VKRLIALIVGVAFAAGLTAVALAQGQSTTTPKPAEGKKPAAHNASGTVKSTTADTVVVAGKAKGKDTEWTFGVDSKTKIRKGGKDVAAADLASGDSVNVRYHEEGGKNVADSVTVRPVKKAAETTKAAEPAKK
jgi:hypothetical protein